MSETVRVTSTARRISRSWLWRLLWIFFRLNLLLLVLALLGFCLGHELSALGADWTIHIRRSLHFPGLPRKGSVFLMLKNLLALLPEMEYLFIGPGGVRYVVPCRSFLLVLGVGGGVLLIAELLFLVEQIFAGRRSARRLLQPLDRMARAAQALGRQATGGEKLHNLEDAISRISPGHPGEKLQTGDRDLQGLEDAINALLERMHESYRQQARFVSDASHELRTPIAVIQGYADMLDRWGKQDAKVLDESIGAIRSEAAYMNRLIEQLLTLARGDTGRSRMHSGPVDLDALLQEVFEDCRMIDPDHDWRISLEPGLGCTGDADMLKQCVRILTDNAMKYTPAGGVIQLGAYADGDYVCIRVQDSGIGVSAEDLQHIFDRFYRSDPARSRASGGTGLGLAIAKWIADCHGGYFDLFSCEGLGMRATLCLPRRTAQ